MEEIASILEGVQSPQQQQRRNAEIAFQDFLQREGAVSMLVEFAGNGTFSAPYRQLALVLTVQQIPSHWSLFQPEVKKQVLDTGFQLIFSDIGTIRTMGMTILSKVAFYGTREERDYLISSVLWLLQYSEVNSIVTALRCLCDIAQEVDEFVTFEIISQSYSRIQELFNNKEYSSNFIIMRRTAKLMRLCINKFSETRMTSGIDTPTMTKLNEFIISWSSISLCWIEQSINSVSTIEHNLAVLLEIFKFLEISLETFPESGVVHNNKTLILSLQLLSVVRDQILAQQSCSIFDTDNTNYTSDGDRVDFEVLVIQLFEVLGVGVGYLSYQDLHIVVKDNLKAIVNMVYEFMRLSPTQIDMWLNDSNRFLYEEQDESFEFHIRQSGHELISQLCRVAKEDAYNPFFTCTKEEIMKYLDSHQLAWIQPQQSHVLRTIGFIISDNIHENATNKQLLWVEGILWSLAAVGKSYMRVINKEKKERKSKVTDASGVKSDDGLSVNSNDTNEFKRRKRKYHSILTAIPPADVTKFIVHALGTLSENTVSVFLRGRALTVYCTFVSLCDISITKGMFYSCIDLLLSSESFTPKMQACRALGLLIYRGTRKFDSNDNSNYNGSMRFEDYMSSAENTLLANNYAQNITNNINNINRVGGTLLYNRSDQDLTAANNNSSGSSNHTILGGSSTNKNSIFTNILNSVKDMIANVDENTVHFVVETLKEMVRKFPNSLILNDVYLICTICMMLWENFMKDSFVIEILKDTLISVAKLPNGIGCKGLYEKFLPFLSDFFNDKSFGNHSIDRNGGMNISGNNGYETNYPSSYNNGNVSMIPIESAYALIARVFAVTRSTYFESARLAKMQILVMLTMNLNRPQLKAYQREILQSLNEIFSSCYYHNEPIETFFRSEDQIKEFCASINSTILEAFVDVDGDFCSTERIGPAIGLMFHSILNCSKYADDRDHIKIIGNALHLILTTNSKYVKYSLVMGFVQLFAHNAEIIMHLLNLVPPANGYNDNIELILGLWFKLHPKLFSRYNGTISTIGLLSILQFSTMDKVNHEFARKVLHVILERLPYILTKGSDSSVIGELNYQDLDRYNNNNDDDYDEDDNEDENSTNTVSDSTMDPYDEYWDGEIVNDENSASDSIATTKFNNPRTDTSDLGAYSPSEMYLSDMIPPPISVVNVPIGGNNSNNSLMNSLNLSNNTNSSNTNINSLTGNNANYTDQSGKQFKNDDELEQDELVFVNVSDNLVFMPATADSLAGNADIEAMLVEILRNQKSSGYYPSWMNGLSIEDKRIIEALDFSNDISGVTMSNRVNDLLASIPIVTRSLLFINILVHVAIFLTDFPIGMVSISAAQVVVRGEYYRIISAAFVHLGIMHIFMNMMSLYQLGTNIENQFGSIKFLFMSAWGVLITGSIFISMNWGYAYLASNLAQYNNSAVGFSGVLFAYALIESFHSSAPYRSVFGFFNVPSKVYPFMLLIILQVIMPNISFVGHLSGLLVGIIMISNVSYLFMPSDEFFQMLDTLSCLQPIYRQSSFIRLKDYDLVHSSLQDCSCMQESGFLKSIKFVWEAVVYVLVLIKNIVVTALYAVGVPVESISRTLDGIFNAVNAAAKSVIDFFQIFYYRVRYGNDTMEADEEDSLMTNRPTVQSV